MRDQLLLRAPFLAYVATQLGGNSSGRRRQRVRDQAYNGGYASAWVVLPWPGREIAHASRNDSANLDRPATL